MGKLPIFSDYPTVRMDDGDKTRAVSKRGVEVNLLRIDLGLNLQMREGGEKEKQGVTVSLVA